MFLPKKPSTKFFSGYSCSCLIWAIYIAISVCTLFLKGDKVGLSFFWEVYLFIGCVVQSVMPAYFVSNWLSFWVRALPVIRYSAPNLRYLVISCLLLMLSSLFRYRMSIFSSSFFVLISTAPSVRSFSLRNMPNFALSFKISGISLRS